MATRSLIARHNRDSSFDSITVTYGAPDWIGPLLVRHYTEDVKVHALMALGPLFHLDREIGAKQNFERPHPEWCVAYERDRGDAGRGSHRSETLPDLVAYARRLFIAHIFVWAVHPLTGAKAWATVPMPEETEESVQALVDDIWKRHRQGGVGLLGLPGEIE